MNDMTVFDYNDMPVRTIQKDSEVWWVLVDICRVLEIKNPHDAASRLDNDEKGVGETDTLGGNQNVTVINEPGLYNLIFRSNKPEAKLFKRWVTHEVLPAIRKNGTYGKPDDRLEVARLIASCKSASAVKAICSLYDIGHDKPVMPTEFEESDSVSKWLNTVQNGLFGAKVEFAYKDYLSFCKTERLEKCPLSTFSKRIHTLTGLIVKRRRVNGTLEGFYYNA